MERQDPDQSSMGQNPLSDCDEQVQEKVLAAKNSTDEDSEFEKAVVELFLRFKDHFELQVLYGSETSLSRSYYLVDFLREDLKNESHSPMRLPLFHAYKHLMSLCEKAHNSVLPALDEDLPHLPTAVENTFVAISTYSYHDYDENEPYLLSSDEDEFREIISTAFEAIKTLIERSTALERKWNERIFEEDRQMIDAVHEGTVGLIGNSRDIFNVAFDIVVLMVGYLAVEIVKSSIADDE